MSQAEQELEQFKIDYDKRITDCFEVDNILMREQVFSSIMADARNFEMAKEVREEADRQCNRLNRPYLWEAPVPFDEEPELEPFPLKALPGFLPDYVKAMSESIQIAPEMCVLPLLGVLSLLIQGKAKILNPGGKNIEELCIYSLTVADPGERKSSCNLLLKPLWNCQKQYNESHALEIKQYQTELRQAITAREKAIKAENQLEKAKGIDAKILELENNKIAPIQKILADATPESIVKVMPSQSEKIGIISDESTLFDALNYSTSPNINILLNAYDGTPYNSSRITRESVYLQNPLLTISLMCQPYVLSELMENKQYIGRGLLQR